MKKILAMLLAAVLCCGIACAAAEPVGEPAAEIAEGTYEDGTGVFFVIPEGSKVLRAEETDTFPSVFLSTGGWDSGIYMNYNPTDLWEGLGEKAGEHGMTREDIGPDFMDNEALMDILVSDSILENMIREEHNGTPYLVLKYHQDFTESGEAVYTAEAVTIKNAYLYMFSLFTMEESDEYYTAFEAWLDSVSYAE